MPFGYCALPCYTQEQLAAARKDPAEAPLADKERAMLQFVVRGTRTPKAVQAADVARLKALGWQDRDILDGLFHGARNTAVDIVFNALKVENDL